MSTRRLFLKSAGLAGIAFGAAPPLLARALAVSSGGGKRVLVVVFQRGACDGLNSVVPFDDRNYRKSRPSIAIPAPKRGGTDTAIDLDGRFALHPSLAPLVPAWQDGTLAIVHAVGSPDPTRSHFDAQDFMESGTPGIKSTRDGWLNRHLQATSPLDDVPLRAVSLTPTLPRALAGRAPAVAMANVESFEVRPIAGGAAARGFESMYRDAVRDALARPAGDAFDAIRTLRESDLGGAAAGARYPRGRLGDSLRQVAQLVKADVGLEVAFAESEGWDHHAAEGGVEGQLAVRLRELGGALAAFREDLGSRFADVVVVTLTEFGRTVRENGNRGTDHGHGSVSLVLGGSVSGGRVLGRWPGLDRDALHEGRDLAVTTDFRDLLGELLTGHLGAADLSTVFPGHVSAAGAFPGTLRA